MAFIRNDSEEPQNGPFFIIAPGEVVEVPDNWISRRDDRVRRGQFTVVEKPKPAVSVEPKPEKVEEKPKPKKAPAKN